MKRINNKEYLEAHTLAEEINRQITADKISNDDIIEKLKRNSQAETLISRLKSAERHKEILEELNKTDKHSNIKRLIGRAEHQKQKQGIKRRILSLSAIAAAVIAVSFAIYNINEPQTELVIANGEAPSYKEPTLVFYNGDKISLAGKDINIENMAYEIATNDDRKLNLNSVPADTIIKYNKLIVPSGFNYSVVLSDSTEVFLNANSSLIFPVAFSGNQRDVELHGEAYFKVTKADKPFIIKTNLGDVKVYGTEFNIKLDGSSKMETVLIHGSVGVNISGHKEVMMTPNQMVTFDKNSKEIKINTVKTSNYTQWCDNNFNYDNYSLESVLNDVSSWYNIPIECLNNIKGVNITFFASRDTKIEEIINIIELGTNVKFKKEGKGGYRVER